MKTIENKIALVTGAASGIGKAIAIRLGKEGAKVIVNYLKQEDEAEKVVQQIKNLGGTASKSQADISKEDDVKKLFSTIEKDFGTLDILVNNAGRQKDADFLNMTLDDWNAVIEVDLTGHFLCSREAAKLFKDKSDKENQPSAGVIIFITSVHQNIPWAKRANYSAAKAGASMLMRTIAQELAPCKIRSNAVAPGAVKTPINIDNFQDPEEKEKIMRKIPYGRPGKVEDIAAAVAWLASDQADYITGETIFVDGGMELYADFAHGG
ncbi:MAG TPA: 3-oxoacyl-ACP reductase FabG [Sunxiuqinia sp.]|nr:3-oxoacyl-ACP reductase FabG [Sunxiuqinia sp.]